MSARDGIGMTSGRTRMRMIENLRKEGVTDERVLNAMAEIPRHVFVDEGIASRAYEDVALPIGHGQTISSPAIVGLMTQLLLAVKPMDRVLEVGTGCGYQTAVLGKLVKEVYTLERIAPLMDKARRHLRDLRFYNIRYKHADGHSGYPEGAPYDGILMAASATHVPEALHRLVEAYLSVGMIEEAQRMAAIALSNFVTIAVMASAFLLAGIVDAGGLDRLAGEASVDGRRRERDAPNAGVHDLVGTRFGCGDAQGRRRQVLFTRLHRTVAAACGREKGEQSQGAAGYASGEVDIEWHGAVRGRDAPRAPSQLREAPALLKTIEAGGRITDDGRPASCHCGSRIIPPAPPRRPPAPARPTRCRT